MYNHLLRRKIFWLLLVVFMFPMTSHAQWGKALHFSWWEHDRVIVPDSPDLFPFVLNKGTLEMWFKPDSVLKSDTHDPDYTYLFSKNISGNVEGDLGLTWKRGEGDLQCFIQDGNVTQDVYPGIPIWEPRWYHIAYVWDTEDSMRVFIDGVESADIEPNEAGEVCIPVYGGTQKIIIGSGSEDLLDNRFETFRGTIDEVRLSGGIARYTSDFTPPTAPFTPDIYTIALWHFDEGSGDLAADATGNGFDGILGKPDSAGYADPEWVEIVRDPKIIINEVLADPASDIDTTAVVEGDANGDGIRDAQEDEFVELLNVTANPVDMTGWKLGDDERIDFTFPDGYIIQPYSFVTVFGGGDVTNVPGYDADPLKTRVFATGDSVGNGLANSGDYVVLQSADGNNDTYFAYGSKYGAGAPTSSAVDGIDWEFETETAANANNNNSVTRYPDASMDSDDPFVEHLSVSDKEFSPNTTIGGKTSLSFGLTVNSVPAEGGTVTLDPEATDYEYGTYVTITAHPADGFVFAGFSGDEESLINPLSISINGNTTVTAMFEPVYKVAPTILVNEILADPSSDPILGDANGDGVRSSSQDEFVELVNVSDAAVDMTGWQLGDDEQLSFTFPDGYMFQPGQLVVIFGGGDVSNVPGYNSDPLQTRVFVSDSTDFVGNGFANGGDFFILLSPDGSYDLYTGYNSKFNSGPPTTDVVAGVDFEIRTEIGANGSNDNSLTRNPDGSTAAADPFVEHLTVSSDPFSPGLTIDGAEVVTGISNDGLKAVPASYELYQNYPNPFNPTTTISFDLPKAGNVAITIYNIRGQEITKLANQHFSAGQYRLTWDGTNHSGNRVASGVYIYRIESGSFTATNKMILMK